MNFKAVLKRALPFLLTLIVGVFLGNFFKPVNGLSKVVSSLETLQHLPVIESKEFHSASNTTSTLTANEYELLIRHGAGGLGSAHNNQADWIETYSMPDNGYKKAQILKLLKPLDWENFDGSKHFGDIVLRATLTETGNICCIVPVLMNSNKKKEIECTEAIKATKQICFKPAMKDGKPVSQRVTIFYRWL